MATACILCTEEVNGTRLLCETCFHDGQQIGQAGLAKQSADTEV